MSQQGGNATVYSAYGVCGTPGHTNDQCPNIKGGDLEEVNAVGNPPRRYDPFSNTYNPGWRDHPNLRYGNYMGQNQQSRAPFQQGTQFQAKPHNTQAPQSNTSGSSSGVESLIAQMAEQNLTFQKNAIEFQESTKAQFQQVKTSIDDIQRQMGQMATSINELRSQGSNRLPSQTLVNPKENVNAIHLRSGKALNESVSKRKSKLIEEDLEGEQEAINSGEVSQENAEISIGDRGDGWLDETSILVLKPTGRPVKNLPGPVAPTPKICFLLPVTGGTVKYLPGPVGSTPKILKFLVVTGGPVRDLTGAR